MNKKDKSKNIFTKIAASLPAGVPYLGPVYALKVAQLSSDEQRAYYLVIFSGQS